MWERVENDSMDDFITFLFGTKIMLDKVFDLSEKKTTAKVKRDFYLKTKTKIKIKWGTMFLLLVLLYIYIFCIIFHFNLNSLSFPRGRSPIILLTLCLFRFNDMAFSVCKWYLVLYIYTRVAQKMYFFFVNKSFNADDLWALLNK